MPEPICLCPPDWRREALALLYRRVDRRLRDRAVADALAEADGGLIDLSGLWVAHRRGRLVGTLLTQALAGRAAAIWAPEVVEGWGRSTTARRLLASALDHLRAQGLQIAQALLDETAPLRAATDLSRGGLPRVTTLDYLERDTAAPIEGRPPSVELAWRPFGPETEADFRAVLQATYAESLDMPELEGVRSLDDVIAGHRAAGRFDPSRWLVGHAPNEPEASAVVLLSEIPDRDAWEVAYLGLTPAARGRGLGLAALEHARRLAAPHVHRLELAVDRRNGPALGLYKAAGFRRFDRRAVHLAILGR
jgi:ribosomal protein S18 acetylase RimI-like enzyme